MAQFKRTCSSLGVNLSTIMIEEFKTYASLLLEWNKRIHLVSKGDARGDRILRHFVDSLCVFNILDIPRDSNLLDLGSGAGFPAIPIKIVRNDVKMTLVELIHKKALFLRKLIEVLKLEETTVLNCRVETLAEQADFEGKFDLVTAREIGKLRDSVQMSIPLLKVGGLLVAYKGRGVEKEINEVGSLESGSIRDVAGIKIPEFDLLRWLTVVEKLE